MRGNSFGANLTGNAWGQRTSPPGGYTWDQKDLVDCYAAVKVCSGKLTTQLLEQPVRGQQKTGQSETDPSKIACAAHLRDLAQAYPAEAHDSVVITIDHMPWHRGTVIDEALAHAPHFHVYRLPSYSRRLNPIERFWRILGRRATHNRLDELVFPVLQHLLAAEACQAHAKMSAVGI